MSVSSRDRKSVIYAEVERLRALLDQKEQQLRAQSEEIAQLRARLRAGREAAPQPRTMPTGRPRSELMRRLAITCKASVKWVDGQGPRQYVRGEWVPIPSHLIDYVSKSLGAEVQA
ncbi:MAG TPA: hypothetical protein VIK75_11055 [Calditerricola sp.]